MNSALIPIGVSDLSVISGEPRIQDLRVGERLGYSRPRDVRSVIEENKAELEGYGILVCGNIPQTSRGGRPGAEYRLNEPQALLVCMFSKARNAAAVRKEVIEVYMAYRRGQLAPIPADPWERMTRRQAVVRQMVAFHAETKAPEFAESLAHLLTDGHRTRRLPAFWSDIEARVALINLHRQVTIDEARGVLLDQFGPLRTPSRTAIGRFWMALDTARGAEARRA